MLPTMSVLMYEGLFLAENSLCCAYATWHLPKCLPPFSNITFTWRTALCYPFWRPNPTSISLHQGQQFDPASRNCSILVTRHFVVSHVPVLMLICRYALDVHRDATRLETKHRSTTHAIQMCQDLSLHRLPPSSPLTRKCGLLSLSPNQQECGIWLA